MAERITMQVARYRPEVETDASFQEYEVPCPKDWVVLDGLNYVKDQLDGTLCYSACPIYGLDPQFIGPAAIALAQRYNLDSRDEGSAERLEVLSQHEGIWGCTFVGECTEVCPKHVDPAGAIQRYKLTATMDYMKSFIFPRAKPTTE